MLKAAGVGIDAIGKKFGVSRDSVHRHWQNHVPPETKAAYLAGPGDLAAFVEKATVEGDSVLDYLRLCRGILTVQLAAANEAGDPRMTAYVAEKLIKALETQARISGELGEMAARTLNVTNITNVAVLSEHPAFARLQATLLRALSPFPDARGAVVAALRGLDGDSAPATSPGGMVLEHVA